MRVISKILSIGFLILFFAKIGFTDEFNFRKTNWGMSIQQVKSSELLNVFKENESMLVYKTTVTGKDVLLVYIFTGNQLVRAQCH